MSPRPPVHWQTADHGNGMVEEAQSSADSTAQASSASPPSAKRPKLARPATDDSFVLNALGPLLNAGTSHSLSSTVAAPAAKLAVNWWRKNEQGFPNDACRRHRDVLGLKWHGVCAFLFFASVHYVHLHNDLIRSAAIRERMIFGLESHRGRFARIESNRNRPQ